MKAELQDHEVINIAEQLPLAFMADQRLSLVTGGVHHTFTCVRLHCGRLAWMHSTGHLFLLVNHDNEKWCDNWCKIPIQ